MLTHFTSGLGIVDFCTVAKWRNARIVEENLFYDVVGMMKQLGIM